MPSRASIFFVPSTAASALVLVLLASCAPTAAVAPDALTEAVLANAEYDSPAPVRGVIRLVDGEYHLPAAPDAASEISIVLAPGRLALGDLNNDGISDAAVVLAGSGGGTGTFISLAAVVNDDGLARNVATTDLGDRVQVEAVSIDGGRIAVRMLSHAPGDPLCCPTAETLRIFRLVGDALVEEAPSE